MDLHALYLRCNFWFKDYLKGSPIGAPYREIKYIMEHSYEEGLPLREKALEELLAYYHEHSPYYAQMGGGGKNN